MHHARCFIVHHDQLPTTIDDELRRILNHDSWQSPVTGEVAVGYQKEFHKNERDSALEAEWKASTYNLLKTAAKASDGMLKVQMSEKVWNPDLNPLGENNHDEDESETCTPRSAQIDLPQFNPTNAAATAATL
ncbi:hypothetical protein EK21DRAFT_117382 [Setomelanomma holmii]|uniref:Uncharacterized protein n=1 Tax=Setomelanomma holmii TaxID=210430 RepID=A0A9P4GZL5_9PLEO|nr:hypothetical protein EK21DRAFT_117382 [Setomelanomma holmii]